MPTPDFLIIGAPKSGTTSLYQYLQQHPQIYMSPLKEPHFFLFDGPSPQPMNGPYDEVRRREMIRSWDAYQALFDGRRDELVSGEASIRYMYSPQACDSIKRRLPKVKLIVLLRNPVDRAYSSYRRDVQHGNESKVSFKVALADGERREREGWFIGTHERLGFYHAYLQRFYDTFDASQIRVYLYDELRNDPVALTRDLFGFLGVDDTFQPDMSVKFNVTGTIQNPFWRLLWMRTRGLRASLLPFIPMGFRGRFFDFIASQPVKKAESLPISLELRRQLMEVYRDDTLQLQELIQRDLTSWLEDPAITPNKD